MIFLIQSGFAVIRAVGKVARNIYGRKQLFSKLNLESWLEKCCTLTTFGLISGIAYNWFYLAVPCRGSVMKMIAWHASERPATAASWSARYYYLHKITPPRLPYLQTLEFRSTTLQCMVAPLHGRRLAILYSMFAFFLVLN